MEITEVYVTNLIELIERIEILEQKTLEGIFFIAGIVVGLLIMEMMSRW